MNIVRNRRRFGAILASTAIVLSVIGAGCSSAPSETPAPKGFPSFYSVPNGATSKPLGSLIKSEKLSISAFHGTTYRVMYVSTGIGNKHAVVTGLVIVPNVAAPSGGYDVVSWAHGTNGMANQCAPSLNATDINATTAPVDTFNALLDKGWALVASDYQGEGSPPGLLPYLIGSLSGQNTIDIVRAAHEMPSAHTSLTYVVWGHSEGGQTAMFSWNMGAGYGSQGGLHMVGVVAGAPPSQFKYIYDALQTSPYRFYLFMAAAGFNLYYGNKSAPLQEVLTAKGLAQLPTLSKGCFDYLMNALDKFQIQELVKADPFTIPTWQPLLEENDPNSFTTATKIPLLILQGGSDEQIPPVSTQLLAAHLCSVGDTVQRWIYPGLSHTGVIPVSTQDMIQWISERFAGTPAPSTYQPQGAQGLTVSACG